MRAVFLFLLTLFPFTLPCLSLKDKFYSAEVGDYLATRQQQTVTMILVRANTEDTLVIEEFSALQKDALPSVKSWVEKKAPNATSHHLFTFDKHQNKLVGLTCLLTGQNLAITQEASILFTELFFLPLKPIAMADRKKIGPPPEGDDPDHRSIWNPTWIFEGKNKKSSYDVFSIIWPKDGSFFSQKPVELYFAKNFSFPIWIEAKTLPIRLILHAIDSGKQFFPTQDLPKK